MADDITTLIEEIQKDLPPWPGDRPPDSFGPEAQDRFRLEITVPPGPISEQDVLALRRVYRQLQEIPLPAAIRQVREQRRVVIGVAHRTKAEWLREYYRRRGVEITLVPDETNAA
jgi:hypothetical protein